MWCPAMLRLAPQPAHHLFPRGTGIIPKIKLIKKIIAYSEVFVYTPAVG